MLPLYHRGFPVRNWEKLGCRLKRHHRCGTCRLARAKLTILTTPSPRMRPLARTMTGVSSRPRYTLQYQFNRPPMVRARVNEGTLYMPVVAISLLSGTMSKTGSYQRQRQCHQAPKPATAFPALLFLRPLIAQRSTLLLEPIAMPFPVGLCLLPIER